MDSSDPESYSAEMATESSLRSQGDPEVEDFIAFAQSLTTRCSLLISVPGIRKLERKLKAELKFLQQLRSSPRSKQRSQLNSSNLSQLSSVLHAAEHLPGVTQVMKKFHLSGRPEGVLVDVVAGGGHSWIKVIARKAEALHCIWAGQGQFGDRNLMLAAEDFLECAEKHPHTFTVPRVHFAFYNSVTEPMCSALVGRGVAVWGRQVPVSADLSKMISLHLAQDSDSSGGQNSNSDEDDDGVGIHAYADLYTDDPQLQEYLQSSLVENSRKEDCSMKENKSHEHQLPIAPMSTYTSQGSPSQNVLSESVSHYTKNDIAENSSYTSLDVDHHVNDRLCPSSEKRSQPKHALDVFHYLVSSPPDLTVPPLTSTPSSDMLPNAENSVKRANLDITSLITLVSNISHGGCTAEFTDAVLQRQAEEERQEPVLPLMQSFLEDKALFACHSAISCFKSLVDLMGGPKERERTAELLSRITEVEDQPTARAINLKEGGKVKIRSKVIFGTGDSLEAITVTSNMGFVRAAQNQGVEFPSFLHSARALTEVKENGGCFVKTKDKLNK